MVHVFLKEKGRLQIPPPGKKRGKEPCSLPKSAERVSRLFAKWIKETSLSGNSPNFF